MALGDSGAMDWSNPMALFGLSADPVDDDHDDFYDSAPSAHPSGNSTDQKPIPPPPQQQQQQQQQTQQIPQSTSAENKTENQRRAEQLRAKLLAQRQNTPSTKPISRSNTPAKVPQTQSLETPSRTPIVPAPPQAQRHEPVVMHQESKTETAGASSGVAGLDALLAEGKAMADAKAAALATNSPCTSSSTHIQTNKHSKLPNITTEPRILYANSPTAAQSAELPRPNDLSDFYYADLPAWLEVTGYHNLDYRTSKLQTYKERKALEQEAARIAEKLEKLRQVEQETINSLRMGTPVPPPKMAPPPLPATMPVEKPQTNGIKRVHSPESLPAGKTRRREETGGFRIRGANDSPDTRLGASRRPLTPSPTDLERRISYPDVRRRGSIDDYRSRSRDASLERRTSNSYGRDQSHPNRWDTYTPRETSRTGYNPQNRSNSYTGRGPQYRGSAGLDLRKGGVRYFMIKSWNLDNVLAAQRESVWATQVKNEEMLTEAFKTSRHVILLFSVNKSMAFQGYALMTSAPDPKLNKPSFCTKLNWDTSPAFTLRWLGSTPIPFRLIGHLKNTMNPDEKGEPRAVLVGKDGQEISSDAGMGVVWALDEADISEESAGNGY